MIWKESGETGRVSEKKNFKGFTEKVSGKNIFPETFCYSLLPDERRI